jgi:bacillithiol biosynthesis deacetylase BshB1
MSPAQLLVFGPHPDDIEIGMGGTIVRHVARGVTVGLCDLTRGELGSNGTPDERLAEAEDASKVLGAAWRVNLALPDGGLSLAREQRDAIIDLVRRTRPDVVAIPHGTDRHPDHVAAHALLVRAVFDSGLRRILPGLEPWRPGRIFEYFINDTGRPTVLVDVSDVYERKRAALACHRSQFTPDEQGAVATRLTSPRFMQLIESRDRLFGAMAGVQAAEGFVSREPFTVDHLLPIGDSVAALAPQP